MPIDKELLDKPDTDGAKVAPVATPHTSMDRIMELVEQFKPREDQNKEKWLKRAAKGQAIYEALELLSDGVFGARGANIQRRNSQVPASLARLQSYYDNLARGNADYQKMKYSLALKQYGDEQVAEREANRLKAQDDALGKRLDAQKGIADDRNRTQKGIADDRNKTQKGIAAAKIKAQKEIQAMKPKKVEKPNKEEKRYEIITDGGVRNSLSESEIGDVVAAFKTKYTAKLMNNTLGKENIAIIDNLLSTGQLNSPEAQRAFLDQFGKSDPEIRQMIQHYGGTAIPSAPAKSKTQPAAPLFQLPGSNEKFVPGDLSAPGQKLDPNMFDDIF